MNKRREAPIPQTPILHRRGFLRAVSAGLAAASAGAASPDTAAAAPAPANDKRKARYRANSAEVQNFYRVNRYPGR